MGRPRAMPGYASTPLERRYTDNDNWSTNEFDVDWQGVTLYNLCLARWWASCAPAARRRAGICEMGLLRRVAASGAQVGHRYPVRSPRFNVVSPNLQARI
jgi:hypothetical protein